jgi:hypothetical protein
VYTHIYIEDEAVRKEKHKAVEQKRREKTKELLADLQASVCVSV